MSKFFTYLQNKDESNLSEKEKQTLSNKVKNISKKILQKARTTHYIENEIENNKGTEYDYLLLKIAELGILINSRKVPAGSKRQVDFKKLQLLKIQIEASSKDTMSYDLEQQKETFNANAKLDNILNKFYDKFNTSNTKSVEKGIPATDPWDKRLKHMKAQKKLNMAIDIYFLGISARFETQNDTTSIIDKDKYKKLNSSITRNDKKAAVSVDLSKLNEDEKSEVMLLVEELDKALKKYENERED